MAAKYPTLEQKHGMYCQLLRDKSEEYLRKAFHKTFPKPRADLYKELKKHDVALRKLLQKGILNQKQYDLLFPQSKQTDSSKFDTTLLFLLLRYFCGYNAPVNGWNNEPGQNDRSKVANLIRLKIGRNRIQHLPLTITNAEYKDIYLFLRQPLLDLGCPLNEISHARSFKYDNQPAIGSFLGREDELNQIHQAINNNKQTHGAVVAGIPGVGKTELARKYCEQHEQDFEHIIWINCDSIENSFQNIAQSLKLDCLQNQGFKDLKVIAKLISEYFKNEKVLYVFDNCINGGEDLVDVLSPQHHNIITSQIKSWGQDYELIELDVWPKEIAFEFLKNNLNQEKDLFGQLIDEFNCHPLALQHAVAFIKETGMLLKEYLELLSEHKLDVLSEEVALRHGVTKSVFSSFHITLDRIKAKYPRIYEFVSIFAVLEISFVKEEFLERYFATRFDFMKSIKILTNFNLIKNFAKGKLTFYTMPSLYQCSIQINQTQKEEKIIKTIFNTIRKWKYFVNQKVDPLKEAMVWFHQFQYIWYHQSNLRKAMLHEIANDNIRYYLGCLACYATIEFCKEVFKNLYQVMKDKVNDIKLYHVKYDIALLSDTGTATEEMKNILIERHVPSASPEKKQLIDLINLYHWNKTYAMTDFYNEGFFHDKWILDAVEIDPLLRAHKLKELKQYDETLKILFQFEEVKNDIMNVKLKIGCCHILKGKILEGLKVAEHVDDVYPYRVPLQIGRSIFDVGCYEQSTKYLKEFIVRTKTILPICFIRRFEYTRAFLMVEQLLQRQREKPCSRLWFREGLFIAKHMMRRHITIYYITIRRNITKVFLFIK